MKKIVFMLLSSLTIFTACKIDEPNKDLQRIVFNPGNLHFISNSLNPNKETMSALYGNREALQSLSAGNTRPGKGSELKLVTWKYHENPQYTGGTITGELLQIETVQADQKGTISYEEKNLSGKETIHPDKEERIQYIMTYKPVVRP
ncbi:hypothetical protein [Chryseobacterium populi]|uniref:Uncharacterized protein n=1 Tax=Chryseobacterium populi TaxID=1144316 RepID=J2TBA7_9FLAO|nr:hypothetical protein [Chryseobacterium populi]EJL75442.1 hypothetical protein PMI13_00451 [Chryseobacterium populi]